VHSLRSSIEELHCFIGEAENATGESWLDFVFEEVAGPDVDKIDLTTKRSK
jgi:hypothetical protein